MTGHLTYGWLEVFILFGALLLVVVAIFLWAVYLRKIKKRRRKYRDHNFSYGEKLEKGVGDVKEMVVKRYGRRRRERRRLNPTLAETGGLPPRRPPPMNSSPDAK